MARKHQSDRYAFFRAAGRFGLLVSLTLAVCGLLYAGYVVQGRRALLELEADIAAWESSQIVDHFRRLANLGKQGTSVVVTALNANSRKVSRAAERVLNERIDTASLLRPKAAQRRLTDLALLLEQKAPLFDRPAQQRAAKLATRLLLWSGEADGAEARQMIASCERLLRTIATAPANDAGNTATTRRGGGHSIARQTASRSTGHRKSAANATRIGSAETHALDDDTLAPRRRIRPQRPDELVLTLPGGGLPIEPLSVERVDTLLASRAPAARRSGSAENTDSDSSRHAPDARVGGSGRLDGRGSGDEQRFKEPRRLAVANRNARPLSGEAASQTIAGHRNGPLASPPEAGHPTREGTGLRRGHAHSDQDGAGRRLARAGEEPIATGELMRLVRADDATTAAWARDELKARGFTTRHLELLEHLTSPDRQTRIAWARRLPAIPDIDARRWLLWLSEDADPRVRHTAIGLLATTDDFELLEQLAEIALRDNDPMVRQQGFQIQQRLDGRTITASAVKPRR